MGYIKHHAIIVTGYDEKEMKVVRKHAFDLFGSQTSKVIPSKVNGYLSIFIAPDGSKEGWDDSHKGDDKRAAFIEYLKLRHEYCHYVELYYGEDNNKSEITNHN